MSWWAIDLRPAPAQREAMAAWLVARSCNAIEERDDGSLVSFATDEAAADALMEEARAAYGAGLIASRRPLDEVDWTTRWRDGIGPRQFGRLTVTPSWAPAGSARDGIVVVLDPESAFGSGEHGSTRAALSLLERLVRPGDFVVDFGSGSGILGIAAVKLGAARSVGIEVDEDANLIARRNAGRNAVADRCTFLEGDAEVLGPLVGPADLLLSNILRIVNTELLPAISSTLRPGGLAIFSGMEDAEAGEFRRAVEAAGFEPIGEVHDAGWWAVAARWP